MKNCQKSFIVRDKLQKNASRFNFLCVTAEVSDVLQSGDVLRRR